MKAYPLFLIGLEQRRAVVVGGDAEAERKVDGLLACDAAVTLLAAQPTPGLVDLAQSGRLTWIERDYEPGDLHGAFLVIVTARDEALRAAAAAEAAREGALVNVVDDVPRCNFVAGSVVRRGPLVVAISTSGCAPAFAVRLRERLERELGPECGEFLEWMERLRRPLARLDFAVRRKLWYRLVDSAVIHDLRAGRRQAARARIARIIGPAMR
jgi:siroheme synthase-like protein